ncbi:phosphocarrier protein HPr /phosphoenolpyruvate--protein phosphotransferase /PTS system D-fructose-specific IIA component (F1P-forming) (Frc family) [Kushneria sinocarnis]|uniref:phosphoenolpyruvate--protein phosphotransferase n=1 Tax=Kushneria sinocarnis TaxID=595502 RepID=A0A420X026_9GAMM|nr:phosphoenolpyruvate--protein phosphotransferase [Kushneria sinocarnis]RKR06805.1 phosphocarrier protein HPr /phosphoenolpyruvate--protein phosphotransferase /PTS system D-fructose-specific IIA component (F1P-forming) (Frc family) [Kushneria sinocarnis]
MLTLTPDAVLLGQSAGDWREALDHAGSALVGAGLCDTAYARALFDREAQSSTWLGNGIAIPHGTPESREAVQATGIRVLQFPDGVAWHDGNRVTLLVVIAAQSDEHLDILRALTHVLDRPGVAEQLASADSAEAVIALLSRPPVTARLDEHTVAAGVPAQSRQGLVAMAAGRLLDAGCVGPAFMAEIMAAAPVALGQKLWLVQGQQDVQQPALGVATPAHALDDTAAVFCLAHPGGADAETTRAWQALLDRVLELLETGQGAQLATLDQARLLGRLAGEKSDAETARVRVRNAHGLHARPAKQLVQMAREQSVPVRVRLESGNGEAVAASSLTRVLSLGARRGQMLVFSAEGEGAREALDAMAAAVRDGLGEAVTPLNDTSEARPSRNHITPVAPEPAPEADRPLMAVPASPGMSIAPVFVMRLPTFDYAEHGDDAVRENERLDQAIHEADEQLAALIRTAGGDEVAEILSMHEEMLEDPELREAAREAIGEGMSAEAGWWRAIDTSARAQETLADRVLAERAADLRDVGRRVLGVLCGVRMPDPPDHPYILVAEDLGPSDVARLDTRRVKGILTARGGATSHSAILARALGIPAVVGAGPGVMALGNDIEMILDGVRGRVVAEPGSERRARTELSIREHDQRVREAYETRFESATTLDGHHVEVGANLGNTAHAEDAVSHGAEGIGLLRTEFIFMAHPQAPDHDTQVVEYRRAFEALGPERPLVARTLDVGGDKPLDYWPVPQEDNPFLGLRGIRLALTRPDVLETQLRALMVAAEGRPLRIMFPMVKDVEEFLAARAIFERIVAELYPDTHQAPNVQLGVMIEVPSCALLAPSLAEHVDFFSIGTNDLTQYTLAIDRGHSRLSAQADGLHPAVLQLIRMTVEAAHAHGCWVGVCGELASDAQAVPVLVGLGVDELSVSARQVPMVKSWVRRLTLDDARRQAELALTRATSAAVRDALEAL